MSAAPELRKNAKPTLTPEDYRRFLPIVRRTAMKLARKLPAQITVNDLIGYAWIGLVEAFRRAAPDMKPEEFEAYALYRIRGAMLDHLRSLDTQTRSMRATSRRITRTITQLTKTLGRAPEENEIAAELGMTVEALRDALASVDRAGMTRVEMLDIDGELPANDIELPEDGAARAELGRAVEGAVKKLSPRLQQVMHLYYVEECTLREIGTILDVTESRVCQLHAEAIHRIRASVGKE